MHIGVIGGGAAGIFGAIAAAQASPTASVEVLEATSEPLDKVRISGGGRCNVTHHCFDPAELVKGYPRGFRELRGAFSRFQPADTVGWFEKRGVRLKAEDDGRMFPVTDDSATIIDCLLREAKTAGVEIRLRSRVTRVMKDGPGSIRGFSVELHDSTVKQYDRLLLATGSSPHGYRVAESLGHPIIPRVPSLFTFKVNDPRLHALAGISFENVRLTLILERASLEQVGPMLITHWGLSGPAVLKLSAWGARLLHDSNYRAKLAVNFLKGESSEHLYQALLAHKQSHGKKQLSSEGLFGIPRRYWERILSTIGATETSLWAELDRESMRRIVQELTGAQFEIQGKGTFKDEFVTCGGVDLATVDFRTMQSKVCPGLFLAGEVLDIDGITGGFNFQSAWTTGWIAGNSMII